MGSHAQQAQQLADMVVFAKVVDEAGFSAAARVLGLTTSAVSKQVSRLEAALGARLLHRSTRKLSLTEAGQALHEHATQAARLGGLAQDAVSQLTSRPAGLLRLSTSLAYGRHVLAPLLVSFHQRHPAVRVSLLLADRQVDLIDEGFDLAIRMVDQPDAALAGRPLHQIDFVLCASPGLLAAMPVQVPADLARVPCLGFSFSHLAQKMVWQLGRSGVPDQRVAVSGPVLANSSDVVAELVLQGLGIGLLPRFVVAPQLASGALQTVLPDWQPRGSFSPRVWALWPAHRQLPPKLRAMVDHLVAHLAPDQPAGKTAAAGLPGSAARGHHMPGL